MYVLRGWMVLDFFSRPPPMCPSLENRAIQAFALRRGASRVLAAYSEIP